MNIGCVFYNYCAWHGMMINVVWTLKPSAHKLFISGKLEMKLCCQKSQLKLFVISNTLHSLQIFNWNESYRFFTGIYDFKAATLQTTQAHWKYVPVATFILNSMLVLAHFMTLNWNIQLKAVKAHFNQMTVHLATFYHIGCIMIVRKWRVSAAKNAT